MPSFYGIEGNRVWDVKKACYTKTYTPEDVFYLYEEGKSASETYLIRTLLFYGLPLGDLALKNADAVKDKLKALDEVYLTPRILAGLASGDSYAAEQWAKHEAEAVPLRQKLAALEATKE